MWMPSVGRAEQILFGFWQTVNIGPDWYSKVIRGLTVGVVRSVRFHARVRVFVFVFEVFSKVFIETTLIHNNNSTY